MGSRLNAYYAFMRGSFHAMMMYRLNILVTIVTNVFYIVLIYFLWLSIFNGREVVQGMTFHQVLSYLVLASTLSVVLNTFLSWVVSENVQNGQIAMDLIKPIDFQYRLYADAIGWIFFNLVTMSIPALFVLFGVLGVDAPQISRIPLFLVSCILALFLTLSIEFSVGLLAFYTESLWGIIITKDMVVSVFSGLLIPLPFFPDGMRAVLEWLPFQAIYHTPLTLLTAETLTLSAVGKLLSIQMVWMLIFLLGSRKFYHLMRRKLVINGG